MPSLCNNVAHLWTTRSSSHEVFLGKGVLKICSKIIREHLWRTAISKKLQGNFIEITLRHGCSLVSLLRSFWTPFAKNISEWLFLRYFPEFMVKISLLCNKLIQQGWIQQMPHIVYGSVYYSGFLLQCQAVKALSLELTLTEITSVPWKSSFLILFTVFITLEE